MYALLYGRMWMEQMQELQIILTLSPELVPVDWSPLTTMLTAPNENNRPMYEAKDINNFYLEHSPQIFPQKRSVN